MKKLLFQNLKGPSFVTWWPCQYHFWPDFRYLSVIYKKCKFSVFIKMGKKL